MGVKERLQKELVLLEKLKFWRYIVLGIVSGVVGVLFSLTQNKININYELVFLLLLALISSIIAVKRITSLTKEYNESLDLLEKEE